MTRPFTSKCATCKLWAECDYFETIEAIEDTAAEREGEQLGYAILSSLFTFTCYDYTPIEGEHK